MNQIVHYWVGQNAFKREMPGPNEFVADGIRWGNYWESFTPSYWLAQYWMRQLDQIQRSPHHARGDITQELVFCMLGGFGITTELATAAFERCLEAGLIEKRETSSEAWQGLLRKPLEIAGKFQRYRYPNQKAKYLAAAMQHILEFALDKSSGINLRNDLLKIKGVGYKTAGWVARNCLDADDVAILDIHLIRAGVLSGFFRPDQKVEREYLSMESSYISFCQNLGVRPSVMDCLMWDQMREYGSVIHRALEQRFGTSGKETSTRSHTPIQHSFSY